MHANEVILTFGHSNTAHLFLKEAAKKRQFQASYALHCLQRVSLSSMDLKEHATKGYFSICLHA